jgi:hypothetical protein
MARRLQHRPEKWNAVFGKADGKSKRYSIGPDAVRSDAVAIRSPVHAVLAT